MAPRASPVSSAPHLGGRTAIALFAVTLFAFVIESQLTQYVQASLGYRQPFFIFYCVHSAFAMVFPLHLLYLLGTTEHTLHSLLNGLRTAIIIHLSPEDASNAAKVFPLHRFSLLVAFMTIGLTMPGLLWFIAISLAPLSDVTALWNSNAFWAYVFSVVLFHLPIEARKLGAVALATAGALAVVYGSSIVGTDLDKSEDEAKPTAPLTGDLLTLLASLAYGLYQVVYKKYAALPFDPEFEPSHTDLEYSGSYESISSVVDNETLGNNAPQGQRRREAEYPPPFGLFPNLLTALVGVCTFLVLGFFLPILHVFGFEKFKLPPDFATALGIFGIAATGMIFNAGFMILLGVWGPIVTSVANLLTIVLMFISDTIFGSGAQTVTVWSVGGSLTIMGAFGLLASDMARGR